MSHSDEPFAEFLNDLEDDPAPAPSAGAESLRYTSDASDDEISSLREHKASLQLATDLEMFGLGLRFLPASCAPSSADRNRDSVWVEENIVHLGTTAGAELGELLTLGASALATAARFPSADHEVASDAEAQAAHVIFLSFSLSYAARLGFREPAVRRIKALSKIVSRCTMVEKLTAGQSREYGSSLWACLTALSDEEREFARNHFERIAPSIATTAGALQMKFGAEAPLHADTARLFYPQLIDLLEIEAAVQTAQRAPAGELPARPRRSRLQL